MGDLVSVTLALGHLWWLAPIVAGAWIFAVGLGRAAAREMPPMPEARDRLIDGNYWAAEFYDQEQTW